MQPGHLPGRHPDVATPSTGRLFTYVFDGQESFVQVRMRFRRGGQEGQPSRLQDLSVVGERVSSGGWPNGNDGALLDQDFKQVPLPVVPTCHQHYR
jgi:hypothetical protein